MDTFPTLLECRNFEKNLLCPYDNRHWVNRAVCNTEIYKGITSLTRGYGKHFNAFIYLFIFQLLSKYWFVFLHLKGQSPRKKASHIIFVLYTIYLSKTKFNFNTIKIYFIYNNHWVRVQQRIMYFGWFHFSPCKYPSIYTRYLFNNKFIYLISLHNWSHWVQYQKTGSTQKIF